MNFDDMVPGVFVSLMVILFCLLVILSEASSDQDYTKNVCSYEGGTMHDDVCVRDGRVIPIKPQQR